MHFYLLYITDLVKADYKCEKFTVNDLNVSSIKRKSYSL